MRFIIKFLKELNSAGETVHNSVSAEEIIS